jgi:threonine dehydratase
MPRFFNLRTRIEAAAQKIRSHVRATPLWSSASLSDFASARVICKLENLQVTGSFKARGAFNKILSLSHEERSRGVVAASTGNHGAAVAYALAKLGATGTIFVPRGTSEGKVANIRRFGTDVRYEGDESGATEGFARAFAAERRLTYISPYNDWDVIAGQGTIGLEIAEELPFVEVVVASMGGGGLVGGVGAYLKSVNPDMRVVAASPSNSQAMIESLRKGEIVDVEHKPTLSDATAGGVEHNAITFDLCRSVIDECVAVSEDEIKDALRLFIEGDHMLAEGAAAVACAALAHIKVKDATVVVIICGANISADALKAAL